MASFSVSQVERLDDVTVLQSLEDTDITRGQTITVATVGNLMDGTFTVISTEPYAFAGVSSEGDLVFDYDVIRTNQILYKNAGSDVARQAVSTGTITWSPTCTWVTANETADWLGLDYTDQEDTAFLDLCVAAANDFAYRRRKSARYSDSYALVPNNSARLGTIMYAAALFREKGSVDSFQSFDSMPMTAPTGSMGQILRLLGCNRAAVG